MIDTITSKLLLLLLLLFLIFRRISNLLEKLIHALQPTTYYFWWKEVVSVIKFKTMGVNFFVLLWQEVPSLFHTV